MFFELYNWRPLDWGADALSIGLLSDSACAIYIENVYSKVNASRGTVIIVGLELCWLWLLLADSIEYMINTQLPSSFINKNSLLKIIEIWKKNFLMLYRGNRDVLEVKYTSFSDFQFFVFFLSFISLNFVEEISRALQNCSGCPSSTKDNYTGTLCFPKYYIYIYIQCEAWWSNICTSRKLTFFHRKWK